MEGRLDLIGELYRRGLTHLVEQILLATRDPLTVTACFQVCSHWTRWEVSDLRCGAISSNCLVTACNRIKIQLILA